MLEEGEGDRKDKDMIGRDAGLWFVLPSGGQDVTATSWKSSGLRGATWDGVGLVGGAVGKKAEEQQREQSEEVDHKSVGGSSRGCARLGRSPARNSGC